MVPRSGLGGCHGSCGGLVGGEGGIGTSDGFTLCFGGLCMNGTKGNFKEVCDSKKLTETISFTVA